MPQVFGQKIKVSFFVYTNAFKKEKKSDDGGDSKLSMIENHL